MEISYKEVNGYLIPELEYRSEEQEKHIGKYGLLRRQYLKEHRKARFNIMVLRDTIGEHLLAIDRAANEREEIILKQLAESDPPPDKAADQMAWVRAANRHRAIAEEIILAELIYV